MAVAQDERRLRPELSPLAGGRATVGRYARIDRCSSCSITIQRMSFISSCARRRHAPRPRRSAARRGGRPAACCTASPADAQRSPHCRSATTAGSSAAPLSVSRYSTLRRSSAQGSRSMMPVLDQPRQPVRQDVARDAERALELLEMAEAIERAAQDQERPAFADHLQCGGQAASRQDAPDRVFVLQGLLLAA